MRIPDRDRPPSGVLSVQANWFGPVMWKDTGTNYKPQLSVLSVLSHFIFLPLPHCLANSFLKATMSSFGDPNESTR